MGTPFVTMSKTAERLCARATISCSFSGRRVALHAEGHADPLEAVAIVVVQAERALYVHVTLEGRLHLGETDAAGCGDVHEGRRQAAGQRVEEILGRIGAGVGAEQDRRLARVELELVLARRVFLARAVEAANRRAIVRAVDPAVRRAELELAERRLGLDRVQRPIHDVRVDAVPDLVHRCAHCVSSLLVSGSRPVDA